MQDAALSCGGSTGAMVLISGLVKQALLDALQSDILWEMTGIWFRKRGKNKCHHYKLTSLTEQFHILAVAAHGSVGIGGGKG